ncbi:hypothetical protein [Methylomagnum ishizawai]|nr:hypothetical protein [Methylomagnum ishizawai]
MDDGARLREQGRLILAMDGLQPDKGHEVLWVLEGIQVLGVVFMF